MLKAAIRFASLSPLFCPITSWAVTVGPGTITTTVTQATAGTTTTIVGNTTINTQGSGGNAVNITSGTVELAGTGIVIESNTIGINVNGTTSIPAYLNSLAGSQVTITTSGTPNAHGISVSGTSPAAGVPLVSLNNASITTSGTSSYGMLLNPGASANLTDINIITSGASSTGMFFNNSNTVTANGVSITTQNANSNGFFATGSNLNFDDLTISTNGNNSRGLELSSSTMILNNSNITTHMGITSIGVLLNNGSHIDIDNSVITTEGVDSYGIRTQVNSSSINMSNSSVITQGTTSHGILGSNSSTINFSNVNLNTANNGSVGMYLVGSTIGTYQGGQINTLGTNAHGIYMDSNSSLTAGNLTITTSGAGAIGVQAYNSNLTLNDSSIVSNTALGISLMANTIFNGNNLSITTNGTNTTGLTSSSSNLTLTNSSINTLSNGTFGISLGASTMNGDNLTITTMGTNASGVALTGSNLTLINSDITTQSTGSTGLSFTNTSTLNGNNLVISTTGSTALGVSGNASNLTLNNSSIQTQGSASSGISLANNTSFSGDTLTITTIGTNALGVTATASSLTLLNSIISTQANGTSSISLSSGASINGDNLAITTNGTTARGLNMDAASATLNNSQLSTQGSNAHGIGMLNSTLNANNISVATQGNNAASLYITANALATLNTAILSGAQLSSAQGPSIAVSGGTNTLSLTDSIVSSPSYWLHVGQLAALLPENLERQFAAASNATLTINHSTLNGAALTDTGNVSTVSLNNNSLWNMTDSSNLSSLTNANSQIVFTPPVNDQYKTLTLENYIGQAGIVSLNTFLDADDSPSDTVVIDGGSATGSTGLVINNTLGAGAITTGNGILVVEAINDGTTTEEAFSLVNTVAAGPYEYLLYQGGIDGSLLNNWYLRSTLNDEDVPNYRPEVSLYAAVPSNLLLYSRSVLGSFHERVGAEEQVQQRKNAPLYRSFFNGSWVRVLNRQGKISNQGALKDGPAFDYRLYALQAGVDVFHHQYDTGHRDFMGFFGIGGDNRSHVEHYTQEKAGDANFKAYGAGAYWTHITPNGAYLDGVIQANWFDLNVHSASQVLRSPTAQVFAYSLEGGIPIVLWKQWSIEPEAQVVYQTLPGFNNLDAASQVYMDTTESLIGRLSGRLVWNKDPIAASYSKKRGNMSVWITPSIAYEGRGNSSTQFSSSNGWVPFPSTLKGGWFSVDLGTTVQVNAYVSLYGTLLGETYLNGRGKAYNAMLGCRVNLL